MTIHLPTEVWMDTIRRATSSGIDLDDGVTHGLDIMNWCIALMQRNATTMRTKVTLTELSHQITQIAAEYLYEIITIEKPSDASNLLAKLTQANDSKLMPFHRQWIKLIFMQDLPLPPITPILSDILSLCRGLEGVSWIDSDHGSEWNPLHVKLTGQIPTEIEFLNWSGQVLRTTILASSASVRVLHIGGLVDDSIPSHLVFPSLSHLSVRHSFLPCHLFAVSSMPKLVDLFIQAHFWDASLLRSVLNDVAATLRILRLGDRTIVKPTLFSTILDSCPECIIINPPSFQSPVVFMDIFYYDTPLFEMCHSVLPRDGIRRHKKD
ncbi:hypothetical protein BD410DRAFT_181989 [Rickenella mellea]|uniref:F-box domain-containing protein n=1 Tax=Rickenella mellea TaxID=50990 RepID=A0A4Y7PGK4_9AGAM|nr:hypothetical protein BD410DRAFT_181989 [Rickenella mellea]